MTCPACGGALSQVRRAPLRFRCQVGHSFTAEILAQEQEGSVDEAIRVALRIVDERAVLTEKMADDARRDGRQGLATRYSERAAEARAHAEVLRRATLGDPIHSSTETDAPPTAHP